MVNHFPVWKNTLIALVVALGILFAVPNIFGTDYAVQVSDARSGDVDMGVFTKAKTALEGRGQDIVGSKLLPKRMIFRFETQEEQREALDILTASLGDKYVAALKLAPKTPGWLSSIGGEPMNLGLDLRGGVHFLIEVDMGEWLKKRQKDFVSEFKRLLRENSIRYKKVAASGENGFSLDFKNSSGRDKAEIKIRDNYDGFTYNSEDSPERFILGVRFTEQKLVEIKRTALKKNITTLRKRVNELGVSEPIVQQQGLDRIVVQLPGVQDPDTAKVVLSAVATLDFRLVDEKNDPYAARESGVIPPLSILRKTRDGVPVLLKKRVIVTGDSIIGAASGFSQENGSPEVVITLDSKGAKRMFRGTKNNVGKRMAVLFIDNKVTTKVVNGKKTRVKKRTEDVINVAVINDELSKIFRITSLESPTEAQRLALLLRAGALAAPIEIIEERTVGPSLGEENIKKGLKSVLIGMAIILIFVAVYYKVFGLVANLALMLNVALIISLLSIIQAVLTLPGIAGIVLTVGMAVDANVLVFERIREEIRAGNSPQASIHSGYDKAFSTILDANVTTLIAAVVLFSFGTGAIKGFAITLALGIATSMFTAILGTRAVINLIYGGRNVKKLSI